MKKCELVKLGTIGMKKYKSFMYENLYFQNNVLCSAV